MASLTSSRKNFLNPSIINSLNVGPAPLEHVETAPFSGEKRKYLDQKFKNLFFTCKKWMKNRFEIWTDHEKRGPEDGSFFFKVNLLSGKKTEDRTAIDDTCEIIQTVFFKHAAVFNETKRKVIISIQPHIGRDPLWLPVEEPTLRQQKEALVSSIEHDIQTQLKKPICRMKEIDIKNYYAQITLD